MYKKIELLMLLIMMIGVYLVNRNLVRYVEKDSVEVSQVTGETRIVVDAGHGENDPGKVGTHGELEKDINLEIAGCLERKLTEAGYKVVMTRTEDKILAAKENTNRKTADLKARVDLINETKPFLAVSIHQNSYQDPQVHGAQVFYYAESVEGKIAAGILQNALVEIEPDNHRQAKANADYYLLRKTEVPTIIVECGFLSNEEEANKLSDEGYQEELARTITQGIQTYEKERFREYRAKN